MHYVYLLLPDFSLIFLGYLLCRLTPLNRSVWQPVEALVYFFLFPVLLFHSMVKSPIDLGETSGFLIAGLLVSSSGIALAYALPHLPWLGRHIEGRAHAGAAQVGFRFNAFIALALAERVAGAQGLQLVAVLIGGCVPLLNIAAVWPMTRHSEHHFVRELLRNPFIIATIAGLSANLLGLRIPAAMEPSISRMGAASLVLGLMAAGAGMQWGQLKNQRLLAVSVLSIRHIALPLLAWAIACLLALDGVQTTVLLAFSALPTASSCYVLAARMGCHGPYVAALVTLSTLIALFSVPLVLGGLVNCPC